MIYILGIVLVVAVLLVAFFLFAIWRAILGKSSVDLKLATSVDIQTKRIESLTKKMDSYNTTNGKVSDEMREMNRYFKDKMRGEK